ncbi:NAD-dependent epimerase/dehydratase family protein [Haloarchaeobius sp. DYHT-AS-18]|uniref:NAD-dependent epimerase/dehydratase family protein n=1 Tax=Haloarchaeobius sp. DYHT-AS-18 TaxID=3446117 RepID=UPI003EB939AB
MTIPSISDKKILVTGGAGFIGSHIVDALIDDNEIIVLDNFSSGDRVNIPSSAKVIEGDILNSNVVAEAMEDIDIVFHQAALVSVNKSVKNPVSSHNINVCATLNILENARNEDARVVMASSCAIYGQPSEIPIPESAALNPSSPYGLDKAAIDQYARIYHELYGLETVALRYFNVFGPRQQGGEYSGVISIFVDQARTGGPITIDGNGTQTRDFIHVNDVVRANLLAATTDQVGEAFNVGTGTQTSIKSLAEIIKDIIDSKVNIVHRDPRSGDIECSEADTRKASSQLDFESEISLKEGLKQFLKK